MIGHQGTSETQALVDDLRRRGVETTRVEVKSGAGGIPSSLPETISAFANGAGGTIILGLDDAIQPVAVDAAALRSALAGMAADRLHPPVRGDIEVEVIDGGARVVRFDVAEMSLHDKPCYVTTRGMYQGSYIRGGDGDRRLSSYEVDRLVENRGQPQHDRECVGEATLADFDRRLLDPYLQHMRTSRPRAFEGLGEIDMLRSLGIILPEDELPRPSLAGLLTFGRYPQQFFPQLFVSVVVLPGTELGELGPGRERFVDNRTVEGPLPLMAADTVTALTRHMTRASIMTGVHRDERLEYPVEVVRELIVNALMHRDYSPHARGSQIQVELYPDRLCVRSPGGFFGPIDAADFGAPGVSSSRNALVAKLLADTPLPNSNLMVAENRGSGVPSIMRALHRVGMAPPTFRADLRSVEVTVPHHALLTPQAMDWITSLRARDLTQAQVQALALVREGGQVRNQTLQGWGLHPSDATRELGNLVQRGLLMKVGDRRGASYRLSPEHAESPSATTAAAQDQAALTERQQLLVALLDGEGQLTAAQIADAMALGYGTVIKDLNALIEHGEVEATAPPRSKRRAYRRSTPSLNRTNVKDTS